MNTKTLRFIAIDTLFFRESRPFETFGGIELASLFPPPPRTVAGAIRSAIGEALGADWPAFHANPAKYIINDIKLHDLIGFGDDLGKLHIQGIWISKGNERLYPAPLYLMRKDDALCRLDIGGAEQTSLGRVRLPFLPPGCEGAKPLDKVWLTAQGLEKVLTGNLPAPSDLVEPQEIYAEEPRLGIARDNNRRTVTTGLLYQSRHVRPVREVESGIDVDIAGLDDGTIDHHLVRLGGEGRMAGIKIVDSPPFPQPPAATKATRGLVLTFLSPARFEAQSWLPASFAAEESNGAQVWQGTINNIALTVHCAVIGRCLREGGWDMAEKRPRSVQSLIPAGSAWYCTVKDSDLDTAINALHGHQIGEDQSLGRGLIACGLWNGSESI